MSTVLLSELSWRERVRQSLLMGMAVLSEMSFLDHLEELRQRLIKSLIGLAAGTAVGVLHGRDDRHLLREHPGRDGVREKPDDRIACVDEP
jgi:hypothetical protein